MLLFGFGGYMLRKLDYPVAPAVLSIVLGPLAEKAMRQSLILSDGSMGIFFDFSSQTDSCSDYVHSYCFTYHACFWSYL